MASPAAAGASETRALSLSLVATAVLGGGAVVWGVLSGARVILFDGVYMLAGILLVGISLLASRASSAAPTPDYPFGRHAATPLAVALQGAALLGTVVYGAADAVAVIVGGGSGAAAVSVLVYGFVSAAASLLVVLLLMRAARDSALARAELVSWRAGLLLSLVIAGGGAIALGLTSLGTYPVVAYIDPILVLVASAAILPMAIALVRDGVRELLEAAPPPALRLRIERAVREGAAAAVATGDRRVLPAPTIRATKLGQRLYVEVDFLVSPGEWSVDAEDAVRRAVIERLDGLSLRVWATVELTTDPSLAPDGSGADGGTRPTT